jgi:hypothetical protein
MKRMDKKLINELDELMRRANSDEIIGGSHKQSTPEEIRENNLCKILYDNYGYLKKTPDGHSYNISGVGIEVMEIYGNKPFEALNKEERINKIWSFVGKIGIGTWTLICSLISAIGGIILAHFAKW